MIYFLRRANGDIKIGTTTRFYTRKGQLQGEHGPLELLGYMEGDAVAERELHARFSSLRRGRGEWFAESAELLGFVRENAKQGTPQRETDPLSPIRTTPAENMAMSLYAARLTLETGRRYSQAQALRELLTRYRPDLLERARQTIESRKASRSDEGE